MHTCVYLIVVDNNVARLRDAREEARIGIEPGIEEQGGLGAMEGRDVALELLRIDRIAIQQARATTAYPEARIGSQFCEIGSSEGRRGREGEEVVGGEVD